ncbi:MAG: helix-turn-helix transcriptional regulator [Bdellovibrionaceae bacterium]|nr:helix-turn-helix transcriptional regulator [Pseudobdellovibrionaceae bacterium]
MNFLFKKLRENVYLIEKEYVVKSNTHGSDISGPYWMLIETIIHRGKIWWEVDGKKYFSDRKKVYIFLPAYSWTVEHYLNNTKVSIRGLISKASLDFPHPSVPIMFNSNSDLSKAFSDLSKFLNEAFNIQEIGLCTRPRALSLRTKQILDRDFKNGIKIGDIASRLKTSSAMLSRTFKTDFGYTPAFYKKGLRVTVGMYELMMGTPPIDAAILAGYSDLGRFYKQFKQYLKQTPTAYLDKSKNAKKYK